MIDKENNTIKCDQCNSVKTIDINALKKWSTRKHIQRLNKINKHYCPKCTTQLGFYNNGVILF